MSKGHKRHDVESVKHIRSLIEEGQYNDSSTSRLKLLWSTLQQLATTHQTLTQSSKNVTEQFKQLHDMLVIEEHKINSTINDRLQQTSTNIHNIINEIKSINSIFKPTSCIVDNEDLDNNIEMITTCSSLDQFIEQAFPSISTSKSQGSTDSMKDITDIELLTLVQSTVQHMNGQYQLVRPLMSKFDTKRLNGIKDQVRSCFQLLEDSENHTHDLDHNVMFIYDNSYTLFSPLTNKWTIVEQEGIDMIYKYGSSAVYARGNVYVFGTGENDDPPPTYSVFSVADGQWRHDISLEGVVDEDDQFKYLTAGCYDGDKIIYLIGQNDEEEESRVYSFNIDTPEKERRLNQVGYIDEGHKVTYMFKHFDTLYCMDNDSKDHTINVFDLSTGEQVDWCCVKDKANACTVYEDNMYILFEDGGLGSLPLVRNISIDHIVELAQIPSTTEKAQKGKGYYNMVPSTSEPGTLLVLQGGDMDYKYSIKGNKWTKIKHGKDTTTASAAVL
ncbi:hypothetical protein SAMD00019534_052050 [Acytostelium subglobosum LB1]|uniref:hypothetical protein n=1 Tax=Acytostelium subglobosum LB1 TaxID=1410327 RepID=UPI000644A45A|nr:hypothetical protein SAMD00019534_052050 [Acytostelium subglobosum LB1]GAM22030.1 hypothetical protein SAMD00019534_052050 [Acytostelium subglobosum LB1]|eukprot:XP_012755130.1 hypothetical protein SAMD00019534_052050 [Acytostelium subglobosum LB1]